MFPAAFEWLLELKLTPYNSSKAESEAVEFLELVVESFEIDFC
jgi:hypothetical protein